MQIRLRRLEAGLNAMTFFAIAFLCSLFRFRPRYVPTSSDHSGPKVTDPDEKQGTQCCGDAFDSLPSEEAASRVALAARVAKHTANAKVYEQRDKEAWQAAVAPLVALAHGLYPSLAGDPRRDLPNVRSAARGGSAARSDWGGDQGYQLVPSDGRIPSRFEASRAHGEKWGWTGWIRRMYAVRASPSL